MKARTIRQVFAALLWSVCVASLAHAQTMKQAAPASAENAISGLKVVQEDNGVVVKVSLKNAVTIAPAMFTIANPPRIALDFPGTENALGRSVQDVSLGNLSSMNIVQVSDRTRLVLNLTSMSQVDTRVDKNVLYITLNAPSAAGGMAANAVGKTQRFAESGPAETQRSIRDITFRRGADGAGRILVDLSDPNTGIDLRKEGKNLVVLFRNVSLPDELRRKLDVTDFATPVSFVDTNVEGNGVRMTITPHGLWEDNAYQSDNKFVVEVKPVAENPNKLVQGSRPGYHGAKLSLDFQNVDVRSVLQVIADFTNFNIITSDTVQGNLTLRLKDVPWDQALDIILQAKGLGMRKNGNVIWIAPRDELAAREKLELESQQQIVDLEPLQSETFQLNYQKAKDVYDVLTKKNQTLLSKRGSVIEDDHTNKLFVTDIPSKLAALRKLISEIDIPSRQVLIESRIVEATDTFTKNLGARLAWNQAASAAHNFLNRGNFIAGGGLAATGYQTGQITTPVPDFFTNASSVNLPAAAIAGNQPGQFSMILFNNALTQFLNLEVSALEADGKGKVISSPRVVTADQVEAIIEQGVEIPYQQATSSGATSIAFRKANLSLKVKPQITPDGRVNLTVEINKDTPDTQIVTGGAGVAIDTKHIKTEVLVDNGGTVVIGGIYTQTQQTTVDRVPFLGDLPYVGFFFRSKQSQNDKTELLVFLTPKIINDSLSVR